MNEETFQFSTSWYVTVDGVERPQAAVYSFSTYAQGLDQHRKACLGRWVEGHMVRPEVSELQGISAGKARTIMVGRQLWVDDRPALSAAEFRQLRERVLGKMDARFGEVA